MLHLPTDPTVARAVETVAWIERDYVDDVGLALLPWQRQALMDQYVAGYLTAQADRPRAASWPECTSPTKPDRR